MTTQIYATQVTQYFVNAVAAFEAGGAALNIVGGTLVVGDGNGAVPTISSLIAANGVTHEVWRGQTINSVSVDGTTANQLDIGVEIPAAIGGAEIGPFTVTEFAILDASGNCCVVGTTNLQKTTSAQGQTSDLAWIAAVVVASTSAVTVTPPSAGYATLAQVIAAYNANLPGAQAPITKTDTVGAGGWLNRIFGIVTADNANLGSGRAATAAEFAAGAAAAGSNTLYPWPTLQQVVGALSGLAASIAALSSSLAGYLPKSGGTMTGFLVLNADPTAGLGAATKQYVDNAVGGVSLSGLLPKSGGTMTGALTLAADPTQALQAATKEYVDNKVAGLAYAGGALPVGTTVTAAVSTTVAALPISSMWTIGAAVTSTAGQVSAPSASGIVAAIFNSNATLVPAGETWEVVGFNYSSVSSSSTNGEGEVTTSTAYTYFVQLVRTA